jgi:hypothetical protein
MGEVAGDWGWGGAVTNVCSPDGQVVWTSGAVKDIRSTLRSPTWCAISRGKARSSRTDFGPRTPLFLDVWEQLNNPGFNSVEFEGIRNEAGWIAIVQVRPHLASSAMKCRTAPRKKERATTPVSR